MKGTSLTLLQLSVVRVEEDEEEVVGDEEEAEEEVASG